jgi:type IV secretory pathway TraG/TraD family ATPase VirD4
MLNQLSIYIPAFYGLTVCGLVSGYKRGKVRQERRLSRALLAGLPVMVGLLLAWDIVEGIAGLPRVATGPVLATLDNLLTAIFLLSASALAGAALARRDRVDSHQRGTMLLDEDDPVPQVVDPNTLAIAGHPITLLDETKHFKILGTTGTGKSTLIREMLTKALRRGDRAVIADPDGGYAARFYNPQRGDIILSPFDPRAARWDLFAEMTEPQYADQLALSFIADHAGEEQVWRGFARTYVSSILRQINRFEDQRNLGRFYHLLSVATEDDVRDLLQGTPAARFLGNREGGKFLQSVQSVTGQHLKAIEHLARQAEGELFSIRRWIREGKGVLFLPYHSNEIASLGSLISAWMRIAIFETLSGPESDQRIWFVIDELGAMGAIDGLEDALTRLRKFGGCCILGLQSIAQVRGAFGDAKAQSIVENSGNTVIFRCSASERGGTAEFASRLIGKRQILRPQLSTTDGGFFSRDSRTVSEHVCTEDAIMASEIEQLPDLHGFLKIASQPQWRRVTLRPPEEGRT